VLLKKLALFSDMNDHNSGKSSWDIDVFLKRNRTPDDKQDNDSDAYHPVKRTRVRSSVILPSTSELQQAFRKFQLSCPNEVHFSTLLRNSIVCYLPNELEWARQLVMIKFNERIFEDYPERACEVVPYQMFDAFRRAYPASTPIPLYGLGIKDSVRHVVYSQLVREVVDGRFNPVGLLWECAAKGVVAPNPNYVSMAVDAFDVHCGVTAMHT